MSLGKIKDIWANLIMIWAKFWQIEGSLGHPGNVFADTLAIYSAHMTFYYANSINK